jgi:hypothetical protein
MKIYNMLCSTTFSVITMFISCSPLHAALITTHFNDIDYSAAAGAEVFIIDFDGLGTGVNAGNFAGQIDFGTIGATDPDNVLFGSNALIDAGSTISSNNVGVLEGSLVNSAFAMSMDILSGSIDGIRLFNGASLLANVTFANTSGFIGIVSDMAFDKFELLPKVIASVGNDRVQIDNFRVNAAVSVPEPALLALFGAGLLGFIHLRRRKKTLSLVGEFSRCQ